MAPRHEKEAFYERMAEVLAFGARMSWERLFGNALYLDFSGDDAAVEKLFQEWTCA
jgi:hypothetical protein